MGKGRGDGSMWRTWSIHGTGARQQKGFITHQFILMVTNRGFIKYAGFFNTSSCWLYSCLHWTKDCLGQTRWDTKQIGKDLPANTVHPLSAKVPNANNPEEWVLYRQEQTRVCLKTPSWPLQCYKNTLGVKFLCDICPLLRLSGFFFFNHLLGARTPQRNNSHLWTLLSGETSSCSWSK